MYSPSLPTINSWDQQSALHRCTSISAATVFEHVIFPPTPISPKRARKPPNHAHPTQCVLPAVIRSSALSDRFFRSLPDKSLVPPASRLPSKRLSCYSSLSSPLAIPAKSWITFVKLSLILASTLHRHLFSVCLQYSVRSCTPWRKLFYEYPMNRLSHEYTRHSASGTHTHHDYHELESNLTSPCFTFLLW